MAYWINKIKENRKIDGRMKIANIEDARKSAIKVLESHKEAKGVRIYKSETGSAVYGYVERQVKNFYWVTTDKGYHEYTLDRNGRIAHSNFGISKGW